MFMDTLAGWLVILAAFVAAAALVVWWGIKEEDRQFRADMDEIEAKAAAETQVIPRVGDDVEETQTIRATVHCEALIVDLRPLEETPRPVVIDELGEWYPEDHTAEYPVLLGHVLVQKQWRSLDPATLGLVAV